MALELKNLEWKRDGFRLGPLSMRFQLGHIHRVIGKNGSGKTSLFRLILGRLRPTEGGITWGTGPILSLGVENILFENWTVTENLKFFEALVQKEADPQFVSPLAPYRDRKFSELSSGKKRFVELMIVLAQRVPWKILDEPFTHFDEETRQIGTKAIQDAKRSGQSLIVSAHQDSEMNFADGVSLVL